MHRSLVAAGLVIVVLPLGLVAANSTGSGRWPAGFDRTTLGEAHAAG